MISELHKTVFVHIPKTGGQSVETAFLHSLNLGWEDRAPLLLRFNPDRDVGPERMAHLFGFEYEKFGHVKQPFSDYYRFAFVRNPYDRAVSEFNYRKPKPNVTLRDLFSKIENDPYSDKWRHICPQTNYVFDEEHSSFVVNDVLRFETLEQDWLAVSEKAFGKQIPLTHVNKPKDYRLRARDLTQSDIDYISELYHQDFENFGYVMR